MYVRLKFSLNPRINFQTSLEHSISVFHASFQSIEPYSSIKLTITKWRFLCPLTFLFSKMRGREIFTDTLVNINTRQKKKSMGFPGKSYVHSLGKNHVTASEQLMLLISCIISLASWKLKTSDLFKHGHGKYPLIFGGRVEMCWTVTHCLRKLGSSTRFWKNVQPLNWEGPVL